MNIVRRFALYAAGTILGVSLLGAAWAVVAAATLGHASTLKHWFERSGAYDNIVSIIIENAQEATKNGKNGEIPLNDPAIRKIAESSFSPQLLRSNTENAIDGMYAWLEGKSATPEFTLRFGEAKQRLAEGLGDYATQRMSGLPVCTDAQVKSFAEKGDFDVFTATCRLKGQDPAQIGRDLRDQLLNDTSFLSKADISSSDLKVEKNGVSVPFYEQLSSAPKGFQLTTTSPWVFFSIALLSAAAILFIAPSKKLGMRRIGRILLGSGVGILVVTVILNVSNGRLTTMLAGSNSGSKTFNGVIGNLSSLIVSDLTHTLRLFIIAYIGGGIVLIVASILKQRSARPVSDVGDIPDHHLEPLAKAPISGPVSPGNKVAAADGTDEAKPAKDSEPKKSVKKVVVNDGSETDT